MTRLVLAFVALLTGGLAMTSLARAEAADLQHVGPQPATPAATGTIAVNSSQGLMQALAAAKGGETIVIAPGNYGPLGLSPAARLPARYDRPVTLISADPAQPARFSGLSLIQVGNLILDGLYVDYVFQSSDKGWQSNSLLRGVRDVEIRNTTFDGDVARGVSPVDDGFGFMVALAIRDSQGVTIAHNRIFRFSGGIQTSASRDVTLRSNDIFGLRIDGMQFNASQGVLVEGNYVHDFHAPSSVWDHRDMIQFWTAKTTTPSRDITIRGNVFAAAGGDYTQTIFMGNEEVAHNGAGHEMYYRDVTIEDNVIANAHFHGISLGATDGLVIRRNTLVRNRAAQGPDKNDALWTPGIRLDPKSLDVDVEDNITVGVDGYKGQPDWTLRDNLMVQDRNPAAPGWYDGVFRAARTGDPADLSSYAYVAGSAADRGSYGSALLQSGRIGATLAAISDKRPSVTPAPAAPPRPQRLAYFDTTTATTTVTQMLSGEDPGPGAAPNLPLDQGELALGDSDLTAGLKSPALLALGGARRLDIDVQFRTVPAPSPAGTLLSVPGLLEMSVTPIGMLQVSLALSAGPGITVQTAPLRLHDGAWHDIALRYDASGLSVTIDGQPRARAAGDGGLTAPPRQPVLVLGSSNKSKTINARIRHLSVDVNRND